MRAIVAAQSVLYTLAPSFLTYSAIHRVSLRVLLWRCSINPARLMRAMYESNIPSSNECSIAFAILASTAILTRIRGRFPVRKVNGAVHMVALIMAGVATGVTTTSSFQLCTNAARLLFVLTATACVVRLVLACAPADDTSSMPNIFGVDVRQILAGQWPLVVVCAISWCCSDITKPLTKETFSCIAQLSIMLTRLLCYLLREDDHIEFLTDIREGGVDYMWLITRISVFPAVLVYPLLKQVHRREAMQLSWTMVAAATVVGIGAHVMSYKLRVRRDRLRYEEREQRKRYDGEADDVIITTGWWAVVRQPLVTLDMLTLLAHTLLADPWSFDFDLWIVFVAIVIERGVHARNMTKKLFGRHNRADRLAYIENIRYDVCPFIW